MTPARYSDALAPARAHRAPRRRVARRLGLLLAIAAVATPYALRAETGSRTPPGADHAGADVRAAERATMRRHLRLLRSFPAADTTLAQSPDTLRLWLSEPAELPSTRVTLTRDGATAGTAADGTAKGTAVTLGKAKRGAAKGAPIVVPVPSSLAPGAYTVSWRTMSRDGHVVKGTFAFRVASAP